MMCMTEYGLSAQCCSSGSGSPLAGGGAQGVLQDGQLDIGSSLQFTSTSKFLHGDSKANDFLDNFHSTYLYNRLGYGLSSRLTMSVEFGYWLNKTQIGLNQSDTISTSGIGDLILFPRYDLYNNTDEHNIRTELTLGLAVKIPTGKFNDSLRKIEPFSGTEYYLRNPPAVQPSTGAIDLLFYTFLFRGYPDENISFFANAMYVRKGWNPLGEKTGDYFGLGLFASKTFFENAGVTLQLRSELVGKTEINKDILLYAYPNYDVEATGSKKIFFTPQISYSFGVGFSCFVLSDIPIYQYVTKTQIASQFMLNIGFSYRVIASENQNSY